MKLWKYMRPHYKQIGLCAESCADCDETLTGFSVRFERLPWRLDAELSRLAGTLDVQLGPVVFAFWRNPAHRCYTVADRGAW